MKKFVQVELGKGSFQELDQVAAVKQFTKFAGQAKSVQDIVSTINTAVKVGIRHLHFDPHSKSWNSIASREVA